MIATPIDMINVESDIFEMKYTMILLSLYFGAIKGSLAVE
jgi:hypothetical protein